MNMYGVKMNVQLLLAGGSQFYVIKTKQPIVSSFEIQATWTFLPKMLFRVLYFSKVSDQLIIFFFFLLPYL